ncbi:MAG: hypothetical protein ACQEWV_24895 [Bacillota bacterium]
MFGSYGDSKVPENQLDKDEVVPQEIINVKTDVIQVGHIVAGVSEVINSDIQTLVLGNYPRSNLTTLQLQSYINSLIDEGLSSATVKKVMKL